MKDDELDVALREARAELRAEDAEFRARMKPTRKDMLASGHKAQDVD